MTAGSADTANGAGARLDGWMVGDHPAYDIAGRIDLDLPEPDHHVDSILDAFTLILAG